MSSNSDIEQVKPDLDIDEQLAMHRRGWTAQVVGLVFIFAVVFLAVLGLFGDGILSTQKLNSGNVNVTSERFFRHEARMELEMNTVADGETIVAFENQYLKHLEVETILPEPSSTSVADDHVHYTFDAKGPLAVKFYLVPRKVGNIQGRVMINKQAFELSHFIFP
jgi:hypothetical protein